MGSEMCIRDRLDKHVHGGFGIMIDDVLAGLMACFVIHLVLYAGF